MKADSDAADASGNAPRAYLSVLFFDERFGFVQEGSLSLRVSQSGTGAAALVLSGIKAPKNGYAYVYVSNSSDEMVYFDNLQVSHNRGRVIEENHYYAYGLKIAGISSRKLADMSEGHIENKDLYNDKELIDDADLDWYDYGFRSYDAQIGRFPQLDPLTDGYPYLTPYQYGSDDPITNIDVDGLEGAAATGGLAGDVFKDSKTILQAAVVVTPKLAPAVIKVGLSGTRIALTGIKIAANLVRIQVMTSTLQQGLATQAVQQQLEKQMNDLVSQNVGLSENDQFMIGIQAKKYFNGLNLLAWWNKGEFAKLDRGVINNEGGNVSILNRVLITRGRINEAAKEVPSIMNKSVEIPMALGSGGLNPFVGVGPSGLQRIGKTVIYRQFGPNEYKALMDNNYNFVLGTNFGSKQFWLDEEGLYWWSRSIMRKPFTTKIIINNSALKFGYEFSDAGRYRAISFDSQDALDIFNKNMKIEWIKEFK